MCLNLLEVHLNLLKRIPLIQQKFSHLSNTGGRAGYSKKSE